MWEINYNLNKHIHPERNGYDLIKVTSLYVPVKEVGLNILVRKEVLIPFIQETILKLVESKNDTTDEIKNILGIDEEIINEVIGQLQNEELVYVKSHKVMLTANGNKTLSTLKKIIKEKEELNKIYVDAITGEIIEPNRTPSLSSNSNPCLDAIIKITDDLFVNKFKEVNSIYKKRQKEYYLHDAGENSEVYQILSIKYDNLCYLKKELLVYRNTSDGDIIFECKSNDNTYGRQFSSQIKTYHGASILLERSNNVKKVDLKIDEEKFNNKLALTEAITNQKDKSEIDNLYFKNRYLYENEYVEILENIKNIKPQKVIISSDRLNKVINNGIITALRSNINNIELAFLCDKEDTDFRRFKDYFMKFNNKNKDKIKWKDSYYTNETNIILYPYCLINIRYLTHEVNKRYIIQDICEIIFDKKIIEDKVISCGFNLEEKEHIKEKVKKQSLKRKKDIAGKKLV